MLGRGRSRRRGLLVLLGEGMGEGDTICVRYDFMMIWGGEGLVTSMHGRGRG